MVKDSRAEYLALRSGCAIVDRTDLAVGRMWGRDPIRMLNGLITNDLGRASESEAVYAAMLTPKGRMVSDLRAWIRSSGQGREVLFVFPSAAMEALSDHLKKYLPPMFARWERVGEATVLGVYGPEAGAALESGIGVAVPEGDEGVAAFAADGGWAYALASVSVEGFEVVVPVDAAQAVGEKLIAAGARRAGFEAFEAARVAAGRPRWSAELTEETMPAEAYESAGMLERAVSFSKGCYTGQEVVVRIAHRGHVNRHLRGLSLEEEAESGTPLFRGDDGKEIGRVTTAIGAPPLEQPMALGYVRREVAPGEVVRVGSPEGPPATVGELPFPTR